MLRSFLRRKGPQSFLPLVIVAAALLYPPAASAAAAPPFETPSVQRASEVLPPALVSGPHFRVRDTVTSYGYMRHYVVDSDFGGFEVTGDFALRKLVREIGAIAALKEVRRGEAYLSGLRKAASQSVEFGANLIDDPADTISGIPQGVAGLFRNVRTAVTSKANPSEDSKAEQALAVSANKRELASRLGVDVYSSNKVLQKEEPNSVAWATSLGSLTLTAALAPVGGAAVAVVSATRAAQQVSDSLKEYPPQRLRQMNQDRLLGMGVHSGLAERFLDHPNYTPTHQTVIVSSLEALTGAGGREFFIQESLQAEDEESANYFQNIAELMRGYHAKVSPIREIGVFGPLVFAKAANGVVLIPLPLDHGMWTERSSQRVPGALAIYKASNPEVKKYEAWVTGTISKRGKEGLSKLGVQTVEHVDKQIEFTF